jgi:hypothetical protein
MERALAELRSEAGKGDRLIEVLLDVAAHSLDHFSLAIAANCLRAAAQAGAVAGFFGGVRSAEKSHVFPARTPGGARGAAVNSGGGDGKDEFAILVGVPSHDRLPLIVIAASGGARHVFCFREIEYRIGCHNDQRVQRGTSVGYPDLAVKVK